MPPRPIRNLAPNHLLWRISFPLGTHLRDIRWVVLLLLLLWGILRGVCITPLLLRGILGRDTVSRLLLLGILGVLLGVLLLMLITRILLMVLLLLMGIVWHSLIRLGNRRWIPALSVGTDRRTAGTAAAVGDAWVRGASSQISTRLGVRQEALATH